MARQGRTLPARRQNATDDSLLIRSAESLGRVIGTLQRQLDAARHLTGRGTGTEFSANGHRREPNLAVAGKAQRKAKSARPAKAGGTSAAADRKSKRAAKSAARKTAAGRTRSGTKRRAAKTGRGT